MEKRYKEIDGVRYQVIQNTILGSNVVPVGESLPEVTVSDSGKVLGVDSSGEWVPVDAPSGLPDITGNAGKVLKVNAGATGTEWANETTELPAVTAADEGDVLTVNSSGEWEAASPSGGGLTLYGPYIFTNSESVTLNSNNITSVNLDIILGSDFSTQYILSNEDFPIKIIPIGFNAGNTFAALNAMFMPDLSEGTILPPYLNVYYFGDSLNNTIYDNGAAITFYTDKPLSIYQPA